MVRSRRILCQFGPRERNKENSDRRIRHPGIGDLTTLLVEFLRECLNRCRILFAWENIQREQVEWCHGGRPIGIDRDIRPTSPCRAAYPIRSTSVL